MYTVAILSVKGGVGKSALATGLAVAASRAGLTTALIDIDAQQTSCRWGDRRKLDAPAVISAQSSRLRTVLETAWASSVEYVVVDTAGRNDGSALDAARLADLVLVPCGASMVELETLAATRDPDRVGGAP